MRDIRQYTENLPAGRKMSEEEYTKFIRQCQFVTAHHDYIVDGRLTTYYYVILQHKMTKLPLQHIRYEDLLFVDRDTGKVQVGQKNKHIAAVISEFCQFLFIDHYAGSHLRDIRDLTPEMVEVWIYAYAQRPTKKGTYPKADNVRMHRDIICKFLYELCGVLKMRYLRRNDVLVKNYVKETYGNGYRSRVAVKNEFRIPAPVINERTGLISLNRDMPNAIIPVFIQIAEVYDPELVLAIVLSAYMGLREGEICCLFGEDSDYGAGVICTHEDGKTIGFQLDLTHERLLRSDLKYTGEIKRERIQHAHAHYLERIDYYYEKHLKMIEGKKREKYKPLFVNKHKNRSGVYMAMTVDSYNKRIMKIYNRVLEYCRTSKNVELQKYYDIMISGNYTWGPHAFRHWFTVQLLLRECDAEQIRTLRGDKRIESAEEYLKNKGVLLQYYLRSTDAVGSFLMERSEEMQDDG